jgi:hypothetical protein
LKEGNIEDPTEPVLTIDNRYPGTVKINAKNAITPMNTIKLLSNILPIGIMAIRMKRINRIGNLAMFLNGYLKEFEMIFVTSIIYLI